MPKIVDFLTSYARPVIEQAQKTEPKFQGWRVYRAEILQELEGAIEEAIQLDKPGVRPVTVSIINGDDGVDKVHEAGARLVQSWRKINKLAGSASLGSVRRSMARSRGFAATAGALPTAQTLIDDAVADRIAEQISARVGDNARGQQAGAQQL